jgi:hypothetical protein
MEEEEEEEEEDEEEKEEEDLLGDRPQVVKRRNRSKKPCSNKCMHKNAEEILQLAFSENREVTKQSVWVLLGTTVSQMTKDKLEKTIDWYRQLKVQASNYCKDRAVQDLLYNWVYCSKM